MAIELRHLRYFVAVAEEEHVTRAAERLGIQQPPLSQCIRSIEQSIGAQLLRRRPRGVTLTEAGEAFLANARTVLAQYDRTIAVTRSAARGEQGRLCVGVAPTAPFHPLVPGVIRAFREAYAQVGVTLEECLRTETVDRLRDERMDVAFVRAPANDLPEFDVRPLLVEPMVVALPAEHPLAKGARRSRGIPLRALADEPFVFYARQQGPAFYEATIAACAKAGFHPRAGQEAPRVTTALGLVAAGLGVTVVPASMHRMNMDGVAFLALRGEPRLRAVVNLATRRHESSPVVRRFVQLAEKLAKSARFAA